MTRDWQRIGTCPYPDCEAGVFTLRTEPGRIGYECFCAVLKARAETRARAGEGKQLTLMGASND